MLFKEVSWNYSFHIEHVLHLFPVFFESPCAVVAVGIMEFEPIDRFDTSWKMLSCWPLSRALPLPCSFPEVTLAAPDDFCWFEQLFNCLFSTIYINFCLNPYSGAWCVLYVFCFSCRSSW